MASTFKATIEHVNHTTSRAVVRSHTMLVDRGVAKGGFDLGPAGGEYQLVALGGCFTSHLLAAIRARETALTNVKVAVPAEAAEYIPTTLSEVRRLQTVNWPVVVPMRVAIVERWNREFAH